jgi:hypothetical protein
MKKQSPLRSRSSAARERGFHTKASHSSSGGGGGGLGRLRSYSFAAAAPLLLLPAYALLSGSPARNAAVAPPLPQADTASSPEISLENGSAVDPRAIEAAKEAIRQIRLNAEQDALRAGRAPASVGKTVQENRAAPSTALSALDQINQMAQGSLSAQVQNEAQDVQDARERQLKADLERTMGMSQQELATQYSRELTQARLASKGSTLGDNPSDCSPTDICPLCGKCNCPYETHRRQLGIFLRKGDTMPMALISSVVTFPSAFVQKQEGAPILGARVQGSSMSAQPGMSFSFFQSSGPVPAETVARGRGGQHRR